MIQGKSIKRKIFTGFNFVILMLLVLSCIVPLWYTLCISLSGKAAVAGGMVSLWPVDFTLSSYQAIIKDMGKGVREIGIFFLIVEYQSKGIGKTALDMVEAYFPDTEIFHLITPSQAIRNTVFYINKCGYHIVKVMEFNPTSNTADYVFEKKKQILEVKRNDT